MRRSVCGLVMWVLCWGVWPLQVYAATKKNRDHVPRPVKSTGLITLPSSAMETADEGFEGVAEDSELYLSSKQALLALAFVLKHGGNLAVRLTLAPKVDVWLQQNIFGERKKEQWSQEMLYGHGLMQAFLAVGQAVSAVGSGGLIHRANQRSFFAGVTDEELKTKAIHYDVIASGDFVILDKTIQFPQLGAKVDKKWKDYFKMGVATGVQFTLDVLSVFGGGALVQSYWGALTDSKSLDALRKMIGSIYELGKIDPVFLPRIFSMRAGTLTEYIGSELVLDTLAYAAQRLSAFYAPHLKVSGFYTYYKNAFHHVYFREKTWADTRLERAVMHLNYIDPLFLQKHRSWFWIGHRVTPVNTWKLPVLEQVFDFSKYFTKLSFMGFYRVVFDGVAGPGFLAAVVLGVGSFLLMQALEPMVKKSILQFVNSYHPPKLAHLKPIGFTKAKGTYYYVYDRPDGGGSRVQKTLTKAKDSCLFDKALVTP